MADNSVPAASAPITLGEMVRTRRLPTLLARPGLVAYPQHWQMPAATEKAAFDAIAAGPAPVGFEYFGFAWATVIDGLRGDAPAAAEVLLALRGACDAGPPPARRATVAQHIHALEFIDLFKTAGITDLFWSHATRGQGEVDGIRLHPFPLFPAQTPTGTLEPDSQTRPRRHLANFIGAYNPKIYLTNVRAAIFDDRNEQGDLLIIKREAWHFDRAVYEEQIGGKAGDEARRAIERQHADEYLEAIRRSWFTLCPSGSGPSSIRIFESLCLGSIPIVLTRDLRLPGPEALWQQGAIIEDDSIAGYEAALRRARRMSTDDRLTMLAAGKDLLDAVGPNAFGRLIHATLGTRPE